jgi:GT2 family glycosyltransferase
VTDHPLARPFVSVVIPTYRDWDRLRVCVDALRRQTYPAESFEVIVVDNDPEAVDPWEPPAPNVTILQGAEARKLRRQEQGNHTRKG